MDYSGWKRYAPIIRSLFATTYLLFITAATGVEINTDKDDFSIPLSGTNPVAITWDGQALWILDGADSKLRSIDPATGRVQREISTQIENPRGLAFDGDNFLIFAKDKIKKFNLAQKKSVKVINLNYPREKGFQSAEAIAWDGQFVWTAYFAGFSSSINKIDPQTGEIKLSLFAECHPRGIATDGHTLWTLCYNGETLPPTIDSRVLQAQEHKTQKSRQLLRRIPGHNPIGLVYDGNNLWYADKVLKKIFRFTPKQAPARKGNK